MEQILLNVVHLKKYFSFQEGFFRRKTRDVRAVDDVTFFIKRGETFGLVGESGSGKSTTGRAILRLIEPTEGQVIFDGIDITSLDNNELRNIRKKMQMVFQDPYASLNPRHTVGRILEEPMIVHGMGNAKERRERVEYLLDIVGLDVSHVERYPHQFSGGQRQRIGIARALAVQPQLIIADEPVSALDVSIQSQVLNLFQDLQEQFALTYLFIAHDLSVVKHISDRIAVMYLGRLVELAEKEKLFNQPKHPYTQALLSAVPVPDPDYKKERIILQGELPNQLNVPQGCAFHTRCFAVMDICKDHRPPLRNINEDHFVACHLFH